jgi:hypothetical protein
MIERRNWTAIPGLFILAAGAVMISAYSGASSSQNRSPVQPIKFPHPVHVQKLGLNCLYCHYAANKSPDPGLPAVGTCMGCHASIGPDRLASDLGPKRTSAELKKLWDYADVKVPMTPGLGPNARPIPWIRIHKVPEYVHFPAHAPRQRRRHLSDLSRPDSEDEPGIPVRVAQHGLVRELPRKRIQRR